MTFFNRLLLILRKRKSALCYSIFVDYCINHREHQYIGKDTGKYSFMFNQEKAAILFLFWPSMFLFIVQN